MNSSDIKAEDTVAGKEVAPLLYRDANGDWIMFAYGAKYEVAMSGSMLAMALTARLGK